MRLPGSIATADIRPSTEIGYSDIIFNEIYARKYGGGLSFDSSGTTSNGRNILSGSLYYNDLFGLHDSISISLREGTNSLLHKPASRHAGINFSMPYRDYLLTLSSNYFDYEKKITPRYQSYRYSGLSFNHSVELERLILRNKYGRLNFGTDGAYFNTSDLNNTSTTVMGDRVNANPNMVGRPNVILIINEVTSLNRSYFYGPMEVVGSPADVIIVNPNGITCNGCSFINTPRSSLISGVPDLSGGLKFAITDGGLEIGSEGLIGSGYVDLIARTLKLQGKVAGTSGSNAILGNGVYDYNTKTISGAGLNTPKPQFALDGSAVGSFYDGAIRVISTEAGVGVNLGGDIVGSTVEVSADGDIKINKGGTVASTGAMRIAGKNVTVSGGKILSGFDVVTKATSLSRLTFETDSLVFDKESRFETYGGFTVKGYTAVRAQKFQLKDGYFKSFRGTNDIHASQFIFGDDTLVQLSRSSYGAQFNGITYNGVMTQYFVNHRPEELVFSSEQKTIFDVDSRTYYNGNFLSSTENAVGTNPDFVTKEFKFGTEFKTQGWTCTKRKAWIKGGGCKHWEPVSNSEVDKAITNLQIHRVKFVEDGMEGSFNNMDIAYTDAPRALGTTLFYSSKDPDIEARFEALKDSPRYKVASDPRYYISINNRYEDNKAYYNSPLFLDGKPEFDNIKRAGDGQVMHELIVRQIFGNVNSTYFAPGDYEEAVLQDMVEKGYTLSQSLKLSPYVSLSADMVAALTQDIVRFEVKYINGEPILFPVVYIARSGKGAVVAARPQIEANKINLQVNNLKVGPNSQLVGANETKINVAGDLTNRGIIGAKAGVTDVQVAGITKNTGTLAGANGSNVSAKRVVSESEIVRAGGGGNFADMITSQATLDFAGDWTLNSDEKGKISGNVINGNMHVTGRDGVDLKAQEMHSRQTQSDKRRTKVTDKKTHLVNQINGKFTSNTINAITSEGTKWGSAIDINSLNGKTEFKAVTDTTTVTESRSRGGFLRSTKSQSSATQETVRGNEFAVDASQIKIRGEDDINLVAPKFKQDGTADISSNSGSVNFISPVASSDSSSSSNSNNRLRVRNTVAASHKESVAEGEFAPNFRLNSTSPVNIEVKDPNNMPAWVDPFKASGGTLTATQVETNNWSNKYSKSAFAPELIKLAAVVTSIVMMDPSASAGAALATAAGAQGSMAVAMQQATAAGLTAITANTTSNTLANNGNIGRGLKDTFNKAGSKSILASTLTAGATGGVMDSLGSAPNDVTRLPNKGTDVVNRAKFATVNTATKTGMDVVLLNKNPGSALVDNLRSNVGTQTQSQLANMIGDGRLNGQISQQEQLGLHAAAGATGALIKNTDPWSSMVAAPVSEASAELAFTQGFKPETAANIGKITGSTSGLLTSDVNSASESAITAIDNNFLPMAAQVVRSCAMNPACASLVRDGMAVATAAAMTIYKGTNPNLEGFDIADVKSKLPGFTPETYEASVLTTPAHQDGIQTLATPEHTYDPEINTEGFTAVSDWLKSATNILFKDSNSNVISEVKSSPAQDANEQFIKSGWFPPYSESTQVRTFVTTQEMDFVRVSTDKNPYGAFIVRAKEIDGMTNQEIKEHLALPYTPTLISDVKVPAGTKIRVGVVAKQVDFGIIKDGGVQYQLLDVIPKDNFNNTRELK